MSSTSILRSFMVYAPDYANALGLRQKVREQHLTGLKGLYGSGGLQFGGALLSPDSTEIPDAQPKMVGSMMVIQAENLAEARKRIESDIYWTSNVWDKERLVIMPFVQAKITE